MDRLESLANTLSQVTMYDIKSMYNQAKNVVLNVSEMEAKVREATNDDPWGASSTLMTEIAQGTFNFQQFNEIMPCIYSRFMEKEASQWRQIYKALQLLEYIIKHGSERVVDDARSHLSTIKMLRNFHYIDENGKDQGINVRNRSRELADLLLDLDKVRQERRKAKANRSKYSGVGNDGMSFGGGFSGGGGGGGSKYGGFGSEDVGSSSGYSGGYDRDYSSGGMGSRSGGFSDSAGRKGYEEYDAGDDEDRTSSPVSHRRSESLSRANLGNVALPRKAGEPAPPRTTTAAKTAATTTAKPQTVMDLLGFDDEPAAAATAPKTSAPVASLDDDFDDFQSATPVQTAAPTLPPTTSAPKAGANVFDFLGGAATTAPVAKPVTHAKGPSMSGSAFTMGGAVPTMQPQQSQSSFASFGQPMGGMGMKSPLSPTTTTPAPSTPNYFGGASPLAPTQFNGPPKSTTPSSQPPSSASKGSGAFDDLWSMGLGKPASASPASSKPGASKSMKDLEREKQQAAIWGSPSSSGAQGGRPPAFGSFGPTTTTNGGGGGDDLLL